MDKVIHCHCGFEARAEHEDELVAQVQSHASEAHGMALSHDEALLLAFRAELDATKTLGGVVSHDVMPDSEEEEK